MTLPSGRLLPAGQVLLQVDESERAGSPVEVRAAEDPARLTRNPVRSLGLLLLPPLALKLASTGWRFLRYYTANKPYRLEGPPRLVLRLLAPLLVASTLSLFGSGVALIVVGHGGGLLLSLHAVSFGVWGVLMIVHVLAYLARTLRVGPADWRRHAEQVVGGAGSRRAALSGALLAGVIVALATYLTLRVKNTAWVVLRSRT